MGDTIQIKVPNKECANYLVKLVGDEKAHIDSVKWHSRYNSYVVYEYEPFCSEGFDIIVSISSDDLNTLDFIKYIYDKRQAAIDTLSNMCK